MSRTAFFLRAYNDVDHIGPVIWKFAAKGERPLVIFNTAFPYEEDYRMQFIRAAGDVEVRRILDVDYERFVNSPRYSRNDPRRRLYQLKRDRRFLTARLHQRLFFECRREIALLEKEDISCCVFEWGTPFIRGEIVQKFFTAAKGLGITTVCLPHGCNIYTHPDVNIGYRRSIEKGRVPDQADRRLYEYYVFQNPLRRDQWVKWGYDPVKTQAWGSARFCPEWQRQNLAICPPFQLEPVSEGALRVVFMHHQKTYNINNREIWELLDLLARQDWIHLVIKGSTRSGTEYASKSFYERYADSANVTFADAGANSPALIAWSGSVINFGSSIGIEALLQNKPLLAPVYLHRNRTLFEALGAAIVSTSHDEILQQLQQIRHDPTTNVPATGRAALLREIVYGGKEPHDVLESYYQKLTAPALAY